MTESHFPTYQIASLHCTMLITLTFLFSKRKRARAILDFERRDDDELGFRKNDIVTIVSQRDEHCWVGELNGQQVRGEGEDRLPKLLIPFFGFAKTLPPFTWKSRQC